MLQYFLLLSIVCSRILAKLFNLKNKSKNNGLSVLRVFTSHSQTEMGGDWFSWSYLLIPLSAVVHSDVYDNNSRGCKCSDADVCVVIIIFFLNVGAESVRRLSRLVSRRLLLLGCDWWWWPGSDVTRCTYKNKKERKKRTCDLFTSFHAHTPETRHSGQNGFIEVGEDIKKTSGLRKEQIKSLSGC